jgi:hypothetical protein
MLEPRVAPAVFNVGSTSALRGAIQTADTNSDASNTINVAAGTLSLSKTEILI